MTSPADPGTEPTLPGFRLRTVRTERGMSLDDIAQRSCIPLRALVALEADDYARLPDAVYVRGYLRRYAGMLGIPAQPLLDNLEARYGGADRDDSKSSVCAGRLAARQLPRALVLGGAAVTLILGAVLVLALGRS